MTMIDDLILSDEEIDELDAFLLSGQMPKTGMDVSILDGFLAAVLLNPDFIPPSQWLARVWDMEHARESPAFDDTAQAQRVTTLIMRHYNTVARSIDEDWFEPLCYDVETDDESEVLDAEGWAMGFMLGVSAFVDPWWRPLIEEESDLLAPMILLGTAEGLEALAESGDKRAEVRAIFEAVPDAVAALSEHFRPMREEVERALRAPKRRVEPKVGRNDPCPCGSGKKFKKCCGSDSPPVRH